MTTLLSPGWGKGTPGGGTYWTKERTNDALKQYVSETTGPLPASDDEWNRIKKGRLDLPTFGKVSEYFGTMAWAWKSIGAARSRITVLNSRWSQAEKNYLLDHAGQEPLTMLAARLNRSYASVRTMLGAKGYGLKARENQGHLTALVVAREYGCSYTRVCALLASGELKGDYSERLHRWRVDPADAEAVRGLLTAPKRTHVTTPPDIGNYREKYGIRRLTVHQGVNAAEAAGS